MRAPSVPHPLAQFGSRPFSFYPAVLNIRHNEWIYQSATWSEVLVRNAKTSEIISIPRRYVGEFSRVEAPVMIVGLLAELEYRSGAVLPAKKRVIEMPLAVNDTPRPRPAVPAAVVGIRLEDGKQSRIPKLALAGVALGIVGCVLAINLYHGGENASRVFYTPVAMENLGFNASDDCHTVLETLGPPARDLRQSDAQGREFRLLWYPRHRVQIVLMGQGGAEARYIGALGRYGRPVHSVAIPGFGDSYRLLAALR